MFNDDPIPDGAERLDYSAAITTVKRPSRYVPGQLAYAESFQCPKCLTAMDVPQDGKNVECKCGLRMQVRTMNLYVWPRVAVVA